MAKVLVYHYREIFGPFIKVDSILRYSQALLYEQFNPVRPHS